MASIPADVIKIRKSSRSEFSGAVLKTGQMAFCYNTDLPTIGMELVLRDTEGKSLPNVSHTIAGADSTTYYFFPYGVTGNEPVFSSYKTLWAGFEDPENIRFQFDQPTMTYSVVTTVGTEVKLRSYGNEYSYQNGDSELSVSLPDLSGWYFCYVDENGQMQYEVSDNSEAVYRNACLADIVRYSRVDGTEIAIIARYTDYRANEIETYASSQTKSISVVKGEEVRFTGTLNGYQNGHTSGRYFSARDKQFLVTAQTTEASAVYPRLYFEGTDDYGGAEIKRSIAVNGVPYLTVADTGITGDPQSLVYNNLNLGVWEVLEATNNDYVLVHYAVADNPEAQITTILGQGQYSTLATAQDAIEIEREGLVFNTDVFRDSGIVATAIFKSNTAGNAEQQYVDTDNNLFSYPTSGVLSSGGGSAVTPTWDETLQQNDTAQRTVVIDATNITSDPDAFRVTKDGEPTPRLAITNEGVLLAFDAAIETFGTETFTCINSDFSGVGKMGDAVPDTGASLTIRKPLTVAGNLFTTTPDSVYAGLYEENGTGGDNGDPKYEYVDGGTTYINYSGNVTGVGKMWFIGTTIETGNTAFDNALFRTSAQPSATPYGSYVVVTATGGLSGGDMVDNSGLDLDGLDVDKVNITTDLKVNGTSGATGTFTSNDGKTITVTNGVITGIV